MEEVIKTRVIIILSVIAVIFFLLSVSSCLGARNQKLALDRERAASWDSEQRMSKFLQEKKALDVKLDGLTKDLEAEKAGHEATKKTLIQEQMINNSLKEELQKITKLKEALEEDLKEALMAAKSAKAK
ncbi:MAG TPA: hypothetical protein VMD52_05335 [Patescibacteria group bacterium]|nr:hypothetical protein [Patescibacteria group bacterium]